jgi:hypothetical protein
MVLSLLLLLAAAGCCGGSTAADAGVPDGACGTTAHVFIEDDDVAVDLTTLPTQSVAIDGRTVEAVPLTSIVSDEIVNAWSYSGMLTADQTRSLYDWQIGSNPPITPEQLAGVWYIPAYGDASFNDVSHAPLGWVPVAPCAVRARRRFVVRRDTESATVHLDDLAAQVESISTSTGDTPAVPLAAILDAAGLLGGDPYGAYDYVLIPPDVPSGVRFPWAHQHVENLYWGTTARKTLSTDTTGDLGGGIYGGVANAGFSKVKGLLTITMVPAPDPAHTATAAGGRQLTDPASCVGCHLENGGVAIPVSCSQCHQ